MVSRQHTAPQLLPPRRLRGVVGRGAAPSASPLPLPPQAPLPLAEPKADKACEGDGGAAGGRGADDRAGVAAASSFAAARLEEKEGLSELSRAEKSRAELSRDWERLAEMRPRRSHGSPRSSA